MNGQRQVGVAIEAEDYEILRREASHRGVPLTELVTQVVHTVAAGFKVSTKLESDSRRAGAEAILATDLPIDWGCWDELEREILDARG